MCVYVVLPKNYFFEPTVIIEAVLSQGESIHMSQLTRTSKESFSVSGFSESRDIQLKGTSLTYLE